MGSITFMAMISGLIVALAVGVVTNVLSAIVWLRRQVASKNSSAVYLAATAINDLALMISFLPFPFLGCEDVTDGWACLLNFFFHLSSYILEPFLVLGFSIERLFAIYRPLKVSFHNFMIINITIITAQCTLVQMRGIGIACRPSVRLSVCLSVCDVGDL